METKGIRRILDIYETKKCYSVWVGGLEINNYYWTKEFANSIVNHYKHLGYDDVKMRKEI